MKPVEVKWGNWSEQYSNECLAIMAGFRKEEQTLLDFTIKTYEGKFNSKHSKKVDCI